MSILSFSFEIRLVKIAGVPSFDTISIAVNLTTLSDTILQDLENHIEYIKTNDVLQIK